MGKLTLQKGYHIYKVVVGSGSFYYEEDEYKVFAKTSKEARNKVTKIIESFRGLSDVEEVNYKIKSAKRVYYGNGNGKWKIGSVDYLASIKMAFKMDYEESLSNEKHYNRGN